MSSICGICRLDGAPIERPEIDAMLVALDHWGADARGAWTSHGIGLGHLLLRTTPQSRHDVLPVFDAAHDLAITGDLRLDNRAELATCLGIEASELPTWSDGRLALRAYREWGENCPQRLRGDFAFAIWDGRLRQLLCARDPIGIRPFYFHTDRQGFAFATEIKGLLALPFVNRSVNETWIGDFLHRLPIDGVGTLYRDIRRLEPAHALMFSANGTRQWRYWTLEPLRGLRLTRDEDYIDAFREKLTLAIDRRIDAPLEIGAELSGGLDSSAICAIAQRLLRETGRDLQTFSQVRPATIDPGARIASDARWAIDLLCERAGITRACFLTGEESSVVEMLEWACRYCDQPPQNVVSLYNHDLYEAAASKGVRILLSGFGGNDAVSAGAGQVRRELLNAGRWAELWRYEAAAGGHYPLVGFAALFARSLMPLDSQLVSALTRRGPIWQRFPYRATRDDFRKRIGMWSRTLRSARMYAGADTLDAEVLRRLSVPAVANRLESAHFCTAARRIEYRYPLLDVELVSLYLAVPSRLKYRDGVGRYLFRASLKGDLPDEIRWSTAPRASANPGSGVKRQRDRRALQALLRAVPSNSRLFDYVDAGKLASNTRVGGRPRHVWNRDTEELGVLILGRKLAELENG